MLLFFRRLGRILPVCGKHDLRQLPPDRRLLYLALNTAFIRRLLTVRLLIVWITLITFPDLKKSDPLSHGAAVFKNSAKQPKSTAKSNNTLQKAGFCAIMVMAHIRHSFLAASILIHSLFKHHFFPVTGAFLFYPQYPKDLLLRYFYNTITTA